MKRFLSTAAKAVLLPGLTFSAVMSFSAPAQAAACSDYVTLQDLINGGGTCRQQGAAGNVLFTYISHSGVNPNDATFTASGSGLNTATFGLASNNQPFLEGPIDPNTGLATTATYTFNYSLTHDTRYLSVISNTLSSSLNQNNNTADYDVVSTGSGANLKGTLVGNIITNGLYTYPSPSLLTDTFNTTLSVSRGGIENFSATYTFVTPPPPPATTPGPLPLIGAGAAFGFSRKIRSKMKANAV